MITISTSWSGDGNLYTIDYVNRLVRAIRRNTSVPHEIVLFAGPAARASGHLAHMEPGVRVIESPYGTWWTGMEGHNKNFDGIKTESIFALGLDCVVVGSLDDLLLFPSARAAMKDYPAHACPRGLEEDVSMDVWLSRGGSFHPCYEKWVEMGRPCWNSDTTPASQRVWPMCGQGWLNSRPRPLQVDIFPENWVISYKLGVRGRGLPPDCRIVSFHGRPKPGEVYLSEPWIMEHWR